jgi:1,4-dihydroxy-2-naphthoate polyprenyltransferase
MNQIPGHGIMETAKTPSILFGPMRVPFLLLTPVCVVLGAAAAFHGQGAFRLDWFLIALAGGLCAHISVNALNEYEDFKTGLDHRTTRTPFSGGSGTLPANPDKAHWAAAVGAVALFLTTLAGLYFLRVAGAGLLLVGLPGVIVIVLYTRWLTRDPLLCLLAPGIGFGPCMVMGVDFVMTGTYGAAAFAASLTPLFLVSNLLLINQFPDIVPDAGVGRRHLMIVYGKRAGVIIYGVFLAGSYLSVVVAWLAGWFPAPALAALLTAPLAVHTAAGVAKHHDSGPASLLPYMGRNVVITLATPALLAAGLFAGGFFFR